MALQILEAVKAAASDPVIEFSDIQGDILIGLQKDYECFIGFTIGDLVKFKSALRGMASTGMITSCETTKQREDQIRRMKAAGESTRLSLLGLNVGFTHQGLIKLRGSGIPTADEAFVQGAHVRAPGLGDELTAWTVERFKTGDVDGMLLVTGPDLLQVNDFVDGVLLLLGDGVEPDVYREIGHIRFPEPGHEHFGFEDGISQPGIRGLTLRQNRRDADQGLPGQDLLWPGEFVFDYPGQKSPTGPDEDKTVPSAPVSPPEPWMRNGSYMVWRRLEQKVLAFREAMSSEATKLGMPSDLLAARVVGRWPSGAPVVLAPLADDPVLAADPMRNNDFEFKADDPSQRRCPYAAHIRKTYPRDDLNDGGPPSLAGTSGEVAVQTSRIRRSGIPFGEEVDGKETIGAEASRGLMFVSYQTSIVDQFEFIQKSWANNEDFVIGKTRPGTGDKVIPGHDLIIGQFATREMDEPVSNFPIGDTRSRLTGIPPFVLTTAAAYLFMPSLNAMRTAF